VASCSGNPKKNLRGTGCGVVVELLADEKISQNFVNAKKSCSQNLLQKLPDSRFYFFKKNNFAKICPISWHQNIFTKTFPLYRMLLTSCAFFCNKL
jgi:hypothetical protein